MQRRKFTQLVLGSLTVGLSACAVPASNAGAAPAVAAAKQVEPAQADAAKATAVPAKQQAQKKAAQPTPKSIAEVLVQPTVVAAPAEPLPDGPIAAFIQSDTWINTEKPIAWDNLRGTVTMVEFWTFG